MRLLLFIDLVATAAAVGALFQPGAWYAGPAVAGRRFDRDGRARRRARSPPPSARRTHFRHRAVAQPYPTGGDPSRDGIGTRREETGSHVGDGVESQAVAPGGPRPARQWRL